MPNKKERLTVGRSGPMGLKRTAEIARGRRALESENTYGPGILVAPPPPMYGRILAGEYYKELRM